MFGLKPRLAPADRAALAIVTLAPALLPDAELQWKLANLAQAGADIYVYESAAGTWNLWCYGARIALPDDTAIRARLAGREGGR